MRLTGILGVVVVAAVLGACSSSDSSGKCDTPLDCGQALTCVEGTCTEMVCESHDDCGDDNSTVWCAPAGVNPDQPDQKFCSPVQCTKDEDCGKEGYICDKKYLVCKEGEGSKPDVIDQGDVPEETPDVVETDQVEPPVEGGMRCQACSSDADCDGLKCYPLGGGTFCFGECDTNDDCPSGWMCYQLTNESKQCIPMAFNCDPACLQDGCPEGQVCDQETGACQEGVAKCGECQQDWDCQPGYKCYVEGGYCAPACQDGVCPANAACKTVNSIPVSLCVSNMQPCCIGEDCENPCSAPTPFPLDGGCVECLTDGDCGEGKYCEAGSHSCMDQACQPPTPIQLPDGTCVQCKNNTHCTSIGPDYICENNICTLTDKPEECSYCEPPYPACAQINGVWSCVQCTSDADCPGSTCDMSLYACSGGGDGTPCGTCSSDADCISSLPDKTLKCDPASGCCFDAAGWCDGVESQCDSTANSECLGLMELLMGGMGGGIPGMPEGMAGGVCTCSEPMGMDGLMCLVLGACPAGGCFGDAVCIDPEAIPLLGDMFGPLVGNVDGICLNPSSITGMLGGGLF